ncbi:unnamed protein product [Amoebophrya sp. A120]|nr:unnamed protein product [Amoebophrya sp. A120]|eukprot:GSA120T00002861001.1
MFSSTSFRPLPLLQVPPRTVATLGGSCSGGGATSSSRIRNVCAGMLSPPYPQPAIICADGKSSVAPAGPSIFNMDPWSVFRSDQSDVRRFSADERTLVMRVLPQFRSFAFTAQAAQALKTLREAVPPKKKVIQLSKKERKQLQGNIGKYANSAGRPEFHNVDLDRHGRICEPTDVFEIVITTSKNNVWIVVNNKAREGRTVFSSHAGNVGLRKSGRRTIDAAHRIASNIARKCKRLGVSVCEVRFRWLMKVEAILQAFQAQGLHITRVTHVPRLPKGDPHKCRKRRRV